MTWFQCTLCHQKTQSQTSTDQVPPKQLQQHQAKAAEASAPVASTSKASPPASPSGENVPDDALCPGRKKIGVVEGEVDGGGVAWVDFFFKGGWRGGNTLPEVKHGT